jgi:hypothetical protein
MKDNAEAGNLDPREIRKQVKEVLNSVLIESGLLKQVVETVVERQLEARGGGGGGGERLRQEAAAVAKDFLSKNLGTVFKDEIQGAVTAATKELLSSEQVKILIDDKFRAVTLYLKTEVIPKAVRQAAKEVSEGVH